MLFGKIAHDRMQWGAVPPIILQKGKGGSCVGWGGGSWTGGEAIAPLTSPQSFIGPSSTCFKFYTSPTFSQNVQFYQIACHNIHPIECMIVNVRTFVNMPYYITPFIASCNV